MPPEHQAELPPAVVHVDLDGALEIFAGHGRTHPWPDDRIFESGVEHLLDFLDQNEIRATLFVIASSLQHPCKRRLLEAAVRRGHEVASHTMTHAYLRALEPARKRVELSESRERLQSSLGVAVRGFRAPGYQIDRESVELLAECGYEYDSSAFPTSVFAKYLGVGVDALFTPQRPFSGNSLMELPLPDHRPSPVPFTPSYGLVLGRRYFRWGLERAARSRRPFVLLFHLIDLADPLPTDRQPGWKLRLFTLSSMSAAEKRRRCQEMLDWTRGHYRMISTTSLLQEVTARNTGRADRYPIMHKAEIIELIIECLKEVLVEVKAIPREGVNAQTQLLGNAAMLDSLGLVRLVLEVEQRLADTHDIAITLADERAMSQQRSPFRTVDSLADYIDVLAKERGASAGS